MEWDSRIVKRFLCEVPRRYRLADGALAVQPAAAGITRGSARSDDVLAVALERARLAQARGVAPDASLRRDFVMALDGLIRSAMRQGAGDPAFQITVLAQTHAVVRDYMMLQENAQRDARDMKKAVDAIAHPGKLAAMPDGASRRALQSLHACVAGASLAAVGPALDKALRRLAAAELCQSSDETRERYRQLADLRSHPALERALQRTALANEPAVQEYEALRRRCGPASGSREARAQGRASQQAGAGVEALAAQALRILAACLNRASQSGVTWRVATSLRVPSALAAHADRAKTEWDAVLLRHDARKCQDDVWHPCLFVEAKVSADAAVVDYATLMRGLHQLMKAHPGTDYVFAAHEGPIRLSGRSLASLQVAGGPGPERREEQGPHGLVLYCIQASSPDAVRLLNSASRMRLLSADASVSWAESLKSGARGDPLPLYPLWDRVLHSPSWAAVRDQGAALRQARNLMVGADDMIATATKLARVDVLSRKLD